jgi:hypothetical protein
MLPSTDPIVFEAASEKESLIKIRDGRTDASPLHNRRVSAQPASPPKVMAEYDEAKPKTGRDPHTPKEISEHTKRRPTIPSSVHPSQLTLKETQIRPGIITSYQKKSILAHETDVFEETEPYLTPHLKGSSAGVTAYEEKRMILVLLYERLRSLRAEVEGCVDYKTVKFYSEKMRELK